ncbi:GTPase Era [Jiella sonneratiae]|uniref:GTPase Era n=1 Tax=Jiella sonneratiae TaxID=2816856 RepID=A0ABS3J7T9_9HYPH|nr:GTPase Era [Jiella sonneratiae]MBO0905735.1 GTPase Era [Jiella sonneratiae]
MSDEAEQAPANAEAAGEAAAATSAAGKETGAAGARRSGFVALLGAPNAGKSTLVNQLVGTKVSIVTHKVQTTRALVRGIAMHRNAQIVFVDTPGVFRPKRRLDRAMVKTAWSGARDADVVLAIVDSERGVSEDVERILGRLSERQTTRALLLNKVDRIKRDRLLGLTKELTDRAAFDRVFMISALDGSGCGDLMDWLAATLPEGPWYYPEDQVSDLPMRQLAAEITREKLYLRLHQELPYASHVETELWETRPDGSVRLEQTIYVERDSQKRIVIGHKGETIRAIGEAARKEITEAAEQKVHLFLFVKVRENWGDDPERYREMGLDYPS